MRKDFSPKDKIILAQRSGYICSYPSCEILTVAPNEEGGDKTSSVGMACHIYAASDGINAKRVIKNLTDDTNDQLSDISNGIWMCYTHGKLIDTDERRFTPEILQEWKRINESIARLRQETGVDYKTAYQSLSLDKLIENEVQLPKEFAVNSYVGHALHDSCLSIVFGKDITESIRDFLIEYIKNAYLRGEALNCTLRITSNEIIVIDDGKEFNVRKLYNNGRGGSMSIKKLLDNYGDKVFLTSYRSQDKNTLKISIPKTADKIINSTPCVVQFDFETLHQYGYSYQIKENCNEVFVILPEYFSYSDIALMSEKHPKLLSETRTLVFVLRHVSKDVRKLLVSQFSDCQVIILNEHI